MQYDDSLSGSRRILLQSLLATGALAGFVSWSGICAAARAARSDARAPKAVLTAAEFGDVDAITAQIVPTDEEPGAREARVPYFIDIALGSFFAARAGEFRAGLADFQARAQTAEPTLGAFSAWPSDQQIAFLKTVEKTPFFLLIRDLTVIGLLTMPEYGGNHDAVGWKLMGFVDQHVFAPPFGYYDRDYPGFKRPEPNST